MAPCNTDITLYYHCPGTNIQGFMRFYRQHFPQASVLPKMHILEAHVPDWMEKWGVGLG